ncbi:MAG: hypothetical protein CL609_03040 [Anaerolineaceae bacterium]|nr:hypothetical protein [Anaerolineaceae bacterium]
MEENMTINQEISNTTLIGAAIRETIKKRETLVSGFILPDQSRCVQCGICSFNCPIGVDVRSFALRGLAIQESKCLTCGECVQRCPRGVLRFEHSSSQ